MEKAKKGNWKIEEFPDKFSTVALDKKVSSQEFQQLTIGLVPKEMEDKWFIYINEDWLYFHRSWTGYCIYKIKIEKQNEKYLLKEAFINRVKDQYNADDDNYDKQLVEYLIDRLLLSKNVPFPSFRNLDYSNKSLYKSSIVGYGRSNKEK